MVVENASPEFPHSEKKKRRLNKWVIVLIAVIVVALLSGAGYFLYQYFMNKSIPRQIDISGQRSVKFDDSLTADQVVDSIIVAATPEVTAGNYDKAIAILKQAEAIPTNSHKVTLYQLIAQNYAAKKDKTNATVYYDKAIAALPTDTTLPSENRADLKKQFEDSKAAL